MGPWAHGAHASHGARGPFWALWARLLAALGTLFPCTVRCKVFWCFFGGFSALWVPIGVQRLPFGLPVEARWASFWGCRGFLGPWCGPVPFGCRFGASLKPMGLFLVLSRVFGLPKAACGCGGVGSLPFQCWWPGHSSGRVLSPVPRGVVVFLPEGSPSRVG